MFWIVMLMTLRTRSLILKVKKPCEPCDGCAPNGNPRTWVRTAELVNFIFKTSINRWNQSTKGSAVVADRRWPWRSCAWDSDRPRVVLWDTWYSEYTLLAGAPLFILPHYNSATFTFCAVNLSRSNLVSKLFVYFPEFWPYVYRFTYFSSIMTECFSFSRFWQNFKSMHNLINTKNFINSKFVVDRSLLC